MNKTIKDFNIDVNFEIRGKNNVRRKATWKQRHWFAKKAIKPLGILVDIEIVKE